MTFDEKAVPADMRASVQALMEGRQRVGDEHPVAIVLSDADGDLNLFTNLAHVDAMRMLLTAVLAAFDQPDSLTRISQPDKPQ